jgi:hypothetical protein
VKESLLQKSIGLTPEMRRLELLRLSSGKFKSSGLSKVSGQARDEVRKDLIADIELEALHHYDKEELPV